MKMLEKVPESQGVCNIYHVATRMVFVQCISCMLICQTFKKVERLYKIFRKLDKNQDGRLHVDEFLAGGTELGFGDNEEELRDAFYEIVCPVSSVCSSSVCLVCLPLYVEQIARWNDCI